MDSVKKVIVAVHGIGDQTRFATVQQVLAQFSRYHGRAAAVPLGNFHAAAGSVVFAATDPPQLGGLGFAEVYWADIPRKVVEEKYLLEDVQPWVRTIIGRVHRQGLTTRGLTEADVRMVEQVLGEMLQTISVLERLFFLADKMGVFSFDLKKVLVDFVNDVQIVAEFKQQGGKIGKIFADQMQAVYDELEGAEEIYLVAHSEGTVVAFLGLLTALCTPGNPWISRVRGFMTFGSPIDKHLTLWPELFAPFQAPCDELSLSLPIEWHNYYDYGDPVGFELDMARKQFTSGPWEGVFNFPQGLKGNDHGFARYPLPGKAHNDYWQDEGVFGHFIQNVVYKAPPEVEAEDVQEPPKPMERFKKPPRSKALARIVSWILPYAGAVALLFCAVLVLYKAVNGYLTPDGAGNPEGEILRVFRTVAGIACLLAGLTVMARIPRLTRAWHWRLFGALFFLLSIAGYQAFGSPLSAESSGLGLVGLALVISVVIAIVSALFPAWGMRALLIPGGLAVAYVVYIHLKDADGNLWPVFVAGAVFLYLWWLSALLFDLTFVWHRYIRMSVPIFRENRLLAQGGKP